MNRKLYHPLWRHLPAAAALLAFLVYWTVKGPFPGRVPVHFGIDGMPNQYGSAWEAGGLVIGLSVLFILTSVIIDELWARQEKAKTFNWLSLIDDIVIGALAGIDIGYLVYLKNGDTVFNFPWIYLGLVAGSTIILSILLEKLRPYRPFPRILADQDNPAWQAELFRQTKDNAPFVYWDTQNPLYVSLISTIVPLVMLVAAVLVWFSQPWVAVVLIIVSLPMIIFYGGQRTLVTRQNVMVRYGIFGLKVLQLKTAEIVGVEVHEFAPPRDFGGYGIRFNREMTAYYLRGNRGVKLTTAQGKKYLIGSDNAGRLAGVISAAAVRAA
jgi:hypothetical protein